MSVDLPNPESLELRRTLALESLASSLERLAADFHEFRQIVPVMLGNH